MDHAVRTIAGVAVPGFLYGTAWKEDETQRLTELALQQGFRGIDTANQRRHYVEAAIGPAVAASVAHGQITRADLFLQTKFTFRNGQDDRLPYDPDAPIPTQVEQSFASSLEHLGTDVIDSYLLHGPATRMGLSSADWRAWRAIEAIHERDQARLVGVANVTIEQLQGLVKEARIRPHFVQNRCYASQGWDRRVRQFCAASGIAYQAFALLKVNREVMAHPDMSAMAQRYGRSISQIVFRFALDLGLIPLTGTTDPAHMIADLAVLEFHLEPEEVERIERLAH